MAHVATSRETGRVSGRVYADVTGAFTRETGCARADLAECGWARERTTPAGMDAERRAAREEDDRDVLDAHLPALTTVERSPVER